MINPLDTTLTINVALFQEVKAAILRWPQAFNMEDFWGVRPDGSRRAMMYDPRVDSEPHCGSACCLAGWAIILGLQRSIKAYLDGTYVMGTSATARALLGITFEQGERLFYWAPQGKALRDVTAEEMAAHIDEFLADPGSPEFSFNLSRQPADFHGFPPPASLSPAPNTLHRHPCERPGCHLWAPGECDGQWCSERHECRMHSEGDPQ